MKVADLLISWTKSPSVIVSRDIVVTIDGTNTTYNVGPEVNNFAISASANSSISVFTTVKDALGQTVSSETATFQVPDLTAPLPDTDVAVAITGTHDEPDVPPTPPDSVAGGNRPDFLRSHGAVPAGGKHK
jgi:hypothetical protein